MSNPECKCLKPEGGGTKCPPQHIALCIRGKDKECYGECIPIPNKYHIDSYDFTNWLKDDIEQKVSEYISNTLADAFPYQSKRIDRISESFTNKGGIFTFNSIIGRIYVRFSFEFKDDDLNYGFLQRPNELTF